MKQIKGYPGYLITKNGEIFSLKSNSFLKQFIKSKKAGYPAVNLYVGGNSKIKFEQKCVHELMAITFLKRKPSKKHIVAHLDGNPLNNKIENLKWVTQKENMSHKNIHGTQSYGEKNGNVKLTTEKVKFIKSNKDKFRIIDFARMFDVSDFAISSILKGKTWKHVEVIHA